MRAAIVVMLLVGCRTPHERSPQPKLADVSSDAGIDAAVDALSDTAFAKVDGPCDWNRPDPDNPRCAPERMPLMRCRDINGPNDRFPKCLADDKVVELEKKPIVLEIKRRGTVTNHGTTIVVAGATNRGIDKTWHAVVLDSKMRSIPGGQASITRIDGDEIEVVAHLTADQLDVLAKSVRLTPP
jgi:hypothetical protein